MKVLLNLGNGAFSISQDEGKLSISISAKANAGGGSVAGIVSIKDEGSIIIDEKLALQALAKALESISPAILIPAEIAAEKLAEAAIDKI